MVRGVLVVLGIAWATAAVAAEEPRPVVFVEQDGTVVCNVVVEAEPDEVRAFLADPASARLAPDLLDAQVADRGPCLEFMKTTRGAWNPLHLRTLRCPTKDGFTETLLDSADFNHFQSEWKVEPVDGGTEVTYRVQTDVNLPVPRSAVNQGLKRNALQTVQALVLKLVGKKDR